MIRHINVVGVIVPYARRRGLLCGISSGYVTRECWSAVLKKERSVAKTGRMERWEPRIFWTSWARSRYGRQTASCRCAGRYLND